MGTLPLAVSPLPSRSMRSVENGMLPDIHCPLSPVRRLQQGARLAAAVASTKLTRRACGWCCDTLPALWHFRWVVIEFRFNFENTGVPPCSEWSLHPRVKEYLARYQTAPQISTSKRCRLGDNVICTFPQRSRRLSLEDYAICCHLSISHSCLAAFILQVVPSCSSQRCRTNRPAITGIALQRIRVSCSHTPAS